MYKDTITSIKENISKVMVGKSDIIDLILTSFIAGGHVLLEDLPGTGKTVMAKSLAKSIDGEFSRIQFTPDLMPSDVTGLNYYNQKQGDFIFKAGPVFCNILLADEINRAAPRTQSSLLECMGERQVTIDGVTRPLAAPFFVIATQNPIENAGTYPLPEAQLDRFFMQLSMGLPNEEEELFILNRFIKEEPLETLTAVCEKTTIAEMQLKYKEVYVHPQLLAYIVKIVHATRKHNAIISGISPRGTLALLSASQAYAFVKGRDYIVPEDVKTVAPPVLIHRLFVNRGMRTTGRKIIEDILGTLEVPTEEWRK